MQVSAADRPPGPEPTMATSTQVTLLASEPSARRALLPGVRPFLRACSMTARPRLAAFLTSGLPATSPIRYWPLTAVWELSSIFGTLDMGGAGGWGGVWRGVG